MLKTRTLLIAIMLCTLQGCTTSNFKPAMDSTTNLEGSTADSIQVNTKNTQAATTQEAKQIDNITNNQEVPMWTLYVMAGGIFCFALIIPSPFTFKGF